MSDADERPVVLRLAGIVKTFPGVRALDGVELEVRAGEVHCLLGQNAAGKSTLIKVLAGVHRPAAGSMLWQGEEVSFASPQAATKAGIATIYQELDLVDDLTVAENVFLGHEQSTAGFVRRAQMRAEAQAVLDRLGHGDIPVTRVVGRLPAAAKQVVSMARALSHEARLIVMDEPSAVLAHDEVANLFRVIRELTSRGIAVIYISHRLEEIREIGDRVTVLKDGRTSAVNLPARTTSTNDLVSRMTGRTGGAVLTFAPQLTGAGTAALVLLIMGVTAALSRWRIGSLADRRGAWPFLAPILAGAAAAMAVCAWAVAREHDVVLIAAAIVLGLCYGALQNLTLVVAFAAVPPERLSAASAGWNIGFDAGTASGAVLAGVLATAYSFPVALLALAAICLLTALVTAVTRS